MLVRSLEAAFLFPISRRESVFVDRSIGIVEVAKSKSDREVAVEKCPIIVSDLETVSLHDNVPTWCLEKNCIISWTCEVDCIESVCEECCLEVNNYIYYKLYCRYYIFCVFVWRSGFLGLSLCPLSSYSSYRSARKLHCVDVLWCTWVKCRREVKWDRYGTRLDVNKRVGCRFHIISRAASPPQSASCIRDECFARYPSFLQTFTSIIFNLEIFFTF